MVLVSSQPIATIRAMVGELVERKLESGDVNTGLRSSHGRTVRAYGYTEEKPFGSRETYSKL